MPFAWLCDFDGTVSPADVGAAFARRFSERGEAGSPELLERWKRGEIGHRELSEEQCRRLAVHEGEALQFARRFSLDPGFARFVGEARARGDAVMVVSEGFDFYLRPLLAQAGLADLPWAANRLRFEPDGRVTPEFPFADPGCDSCGNCKAQHVRRHRARGAVTVVVGDGLSDRCGARAADRVIARGGLLTWCRSEGIAAEPFEDFTDVLALARRWTAPAPAGGGEGTHDAHR